MDTAATLDQPSAVNYFRPVWRRRWLILVIVVIATIGTYVYYNGKPRVYSSSASLYVGSGSDIQALLGGGGNSGDPTRELSDLATLIDSPPVVAAAERLIGNAGALSSISATPASSSDFIQLSSTSGSPLDAAATVNAFARAFIQFRTQTQRQEAAVAVAQVQTQLNGVNPNSSQGQVLQQELAALKVQEQQPAENIQQIAPAVPNPAPIAPNPTKDALFALALSLMVGMALAYGLDRLDQRIRSEEELQPSYGMPVLGEISQVLTPTPDDDGVPYVDREHWESFRALRTNLELATGSRPLRTILVASAQPGEGKSLVIRNLALAYADAGFRVAVVEADLRRPTLARLFNVETEPGLSDVLAHVEMLPEAVQPVSRLGGAPWPEREGPSAGVTVKAHQLAGTVNVVTSGAKPDTLTASIAAEGIKSVLARLTEEYDVVLIDSAPLLAVSDSVPLVGVVDGVVLVGRVGTTRVHAARRVTELVGRVSGARVLGVVANSVPKRPFQYGAGY